MARKKYVSAKFVKRPGRGVASAVPGRLVPVTFNPDWGPRPNLMAVALYYANKRRKERQDSDGDVPVPGSIFNYDASTLNLDDGDPVTSLDNLSTDSPPTYNANAQNGLGTITFDGISNYLGGSYIGELSEFTFFLVAICNAHEVRAGIIEIASTNGTASTDPDGIIFADHGDVPAVNNIRTRKSGSTGEALLMLSEVPETAVLYDAFALFENGFAKAYVNGSETAEDNVVNVVPIVNASKVILGARIVGGEPAADFSSFTLCQTILFGRILSDNERAEMSAFLMDKWGIAATVIDLDRDGNPDTTLIGKHMEAGHVTEDIDSINYDMNGDGNADYIIPK